MCLIATTIKTTEFFKFKRWLYENVGIDLKETKLKLVEGRLASRLRHYHLNSYSDYFAMITDRNAHVEAQIAIDLLTTNETYFFREPKHFDFLEQYIVPQFRQDLSKKEKEFRLWCGASSTGEEPYTLAMTLAENMGERPWQIVASDINHQVLEKARSGHYALDRAHNIPKHLLHKYCLKGRGTQEGTFLVNKELRDNIQFRQINLINALPDIGVFDVVFLRNVMIYFDNPTRERVVNKVIDVLKPGGYFVVSHSESLVGISTKLTLLKPSIFIKS